MKRMTRRAFLRTYGWRVGVVLLLAGLFFYTIYHVFGSSSANLLTTPARSVTDYKEYFGTGYLFRDEALLTSSEAGLVDPKVKNGTKVSRGVAVAEVYPASGDLTGKQQRLYTLDRVLSLLDESKLPAGTSASRIVEYRSAAEREYLALRRMVTSGYFSALSDLSDAFFVECNSVETLLGSGGSANALAETYRAEQKSLLSGTPKAVTVDASSGYYYDPTFVDGYESIFTTTALDRLTMESLASLAARAPVSATSGTVAGKIVYSYRWYLAIPMDEEIAEVLEPEMFCRARFSSNAQKELTVECERIIPSDDGKVLVIVSCGESPEGFLFYRSQPVELLVENGSGYYVPDSALRTVKGDVGVYVFETGTVYFRRVEILYRGDGYSIVKRREETERGYLAENDLMVTSGKNLYDGKVYR